MALRTPRHNGTNLIQLVASTRRALSLQRSVGERDLDALYQPLQRSRTITGADTTVGQFGMNGNPMLQQGPSLIATDTDAATKDQFASRPRFNGTAVFPLRTFPFLRGRG